MVNRFAFSVRSCQGVKLHLWDSVTPEEYYTFVLGGPSNIVIQLEHHSPNIMGNFDLVDSISVDGVLSCHENKGFNVYWWGNQVLRLEDVKETFAVEHDFSAYGSSVVRIDTAALETGSSSAEWVVGDKDEQTYIGVTDVQEEGLFRWVSNDQEVDETLISDWWNPSEPNNVGAPPGENHVVFKGINSGLNDVNGGQTQAGYICVKTIMRHSHVVVLPQISTTDVTNYRLIRVTSAHTGNVTVDWMFRDQEVIESGALASFLGRQDTLELSIPADFEMTSPGIYTKFVLLRATEEITVVLSVSSSRAKDSVLFFPTVDLRSHEEYFVVTSGGELRGKDQLIIVSFGRSNRITIVFSEDYSENLEITQSGMTYKYPVSGDVTLDRYQTLVIQSEADLTGTLVTGTAGMIVLAGTLDAEESGGSTLDEALPIDYLGTEYFTFPSIPTDPNEFDTFLILAVHDDTKVTISGRSEVWLQSSGDSRTITLPRHEFHFMTSSLPFYASRLGKVDTSGVCQTTLFPPNIWLSEYSVHIMNVKTAVVFVVEASAFDNHNFLADDVVLQATGLDCHNVLGTTKIGCMMRFSTNGAHVITSRDGVPFPAYLQDTASGTSVKCHPLGAAMTLPSGTSQVFDPDEYLDSQRCLHNETTAYTTTTTTVLSTVTTATDATTIPSTEDTTITTATTTEAAVVTASATNLTASEIEEVTKKIQQELTVSPTNTSSYKRSKTCAVDTRATSAALGVSGVFFVVSVFAFLSFSDILSFMQPQSPHSKDTCKDI